MTSQGVSLILAGLMLVGWPATSPVAAQQADVAAVKKGTQDFSAADKAMAAANSALMAAHTSLDQERFNSAAYNARVTAQQLAAAKERYEKAAPDQKENALEALQLAEELAEQRKKDLAAAEKLLPEREAQFAAAEEKYSAALKTALELADQAKWLVRQGESERQKALELSKQAVEQAAFAKAAAEQGAAAGAEIQKLLTALQAADAALVQAGAALKQALPKDRGEKLAQAEAALKTFAAAAHAAADHLPALKSPGSYFDGLNTAAAVIAADGARQKAATALEQAKKDLQDKEKSLAEAEARVKAAEEGARTRIAKVRALKDLEREQESVKRAALARKEAQAALPEKAAEAERARAQCAAVLQEAVKSLLLAPESEPSLGAEREAIAKAIAEKQAELKATAATLARSAAAAQAEAEKAQAALTATDRQLAERGAARSALEQVLKQRFVRQARATVDERRKAQASLTIANRELPAKTAAVNRAAASLKPLKDAAEKAQRDAKAAHEALEAAQKRAKQAAEAVSDASKKLASVEAEYNRVAEEKAAVEKRIADCRQKIEATPARLARIQAGLYGGLTPLADAEWTYAKARHLLVRAGFGGTPDEVARLHAMGLFGAVRHLVNFEAQPQPNIEFVASPKERPESYESALVGEEQRDLRLARAAADRQQVQNMRAWWLRRMIESPRPLEEKLTLFWHGHFASQYSDVADGFYMFKQNQLFRENAAGNFGTLLYGIAHDAAMLKYLNNDTNVKGRANENLAREIMELFGMGRDQGYSESDIRQGARALTGYTYDTWTGQFRFVSARHDTEPKTIFGKQGNYSGDDFVQLILDTPHAPKFIARQLFVFFAHDNPSPDTVEGLANMLRNNNLELEPMLENLFMSEEFYSPAAMGTQIKSPIQLVVGLHRDLGLKDADVAYLATATRDMGQELFEPPSVFGWQTGRAWVTTSRTFSRYNALAEILERRPRAGKTGVDVVGTVLSGKKFASHAAVVDHLIERCLNVPLAASKRQALVDYLKPLPPPEQWAANPGAANTRLTRLLVMLLCSPEYQLS